MCLLPDTGVFHVEVVLPRAAVDRLVPVAGHHSGQWRPIQRYASISSLWASRVDGLSPDPFGILVSRHFRPFGQECQQLAAT
jgi:hypothetical protein